ncbi:nucleotidyltransferase family protein [Inhella gelatinilytica]|uniref:Nucleotidyltransferase family protein n=1 Tax=Inhella gelatinilytica TaxID=2795030 RepID=A0A931NDY4_9BURK|nr:nucleotidyltransferase family protein [Inhella gelatinilytica]MBH9551931.1 nucleotidyltransferase family protein [Inhella gelatinilytica]
MRPSDALNHHRDAVRRLVTTHRARNPRVFGSVMRGQDGEDSDLDLLIDPDPDMSLFDLGALSSDLQDLLGVTVDVLTPRALPVQWRDAIVAEARPV